MKRAAEPWVKFTESSRLVAIRVRLVMAGLGCVDVAHASMKQVAVGSGGPARDVYPTYKFKS